MPSSEPRLNPSASAVSERELTGGDANQLRSRVPLGTHILLVGTMLLFFSVATLLTLQTTWQWWLIPAAIAVPMAVVLAQRISKVGKARDARLALEADRRAGRGAAAGPETAGRGGSSR